MRRNEVAPYPSSLIISNNVAALLEHDQRTRTTSQAPHNLSPFNRSVSPHSLPFDTDPVPGGLPPPPRGPKKLRIPPTGEDRDRITPSPDSSFTSAKEGTLIRIRSTSPAGSAVTPNPYINPAPDFEALSDSSSSSGLSNSLRAKQSHADDRLRRPISPHSSERLIDRTNSSGGLRRKAYSSRADSPITASLSPQLSTGQILPDMTNPGGVLAEQFPDPAFPPTPTTGTSLLPESRSHTAVSGERSTGRKLALRSDVGQQGSTSTALRRAPLSQQSRPNTRPLLSHAPHTSESSMHSQSSASASSHEPPSTAHEPRISISSTIYPPSTYPKAPDSPLEFYPAHNPGNSLSSPMYSDRYTHPGAKQDISPDRHSFIDFASPSARFSPMSNSSDPNSVDAYAHTPSLPTNHPLSLRPIPSGPQLSTQSDEQIQNGHVSPISLNPLRSLSPFDSKPPIPTTPKPVFRFATLASATPPVSSSATSPKLEEKGHLLNPQERAERVRKTRKLAQVFGLPPAGLSVLEADLPPPAANGLSGAVTVLAQRHGHMRGAVSMSSEADVGGLSGRHPSPLATRAPPGNILYISNSSRRHSSPFSPEDFTFTAGDHPLVLHPLGSKSSEEIDFGRVIDIRRSPSRETDDSSSQHLGTDLPDSPTSFFELSDEEGDNSPTEPRSLRRRSDSPLESPPPDDKTADEELEQERRRKREKLVKLHRFLGSRVPADMVLGPHNSGPPLPPLPPSTSDGPGLATLSEDDDSRPNWLRRRRRSSFSAAYPTHWSDDVDRLKDDLNEKEKAINVRRALKMEKMFGTQPPQTLYHTRPPPTASNQVFNSPTSPTSPNRNSNQSSYLKGKAKKTRRPGTAESTQLLLPIRTSDSHEDDSLSQQSPRLSVPQGSWSLSDVYMHYRNSLNSLKDIIDRDDKQSLAELHEYMNTEASDYAPANEQHVMTPGSTSAVRNERRRSLPLRASLLSLTSEYSVATPKPQVSTFEVRRRRAAKLQHFFGVHYRDLFGEVLESIERGVEEESGRGSLRADEYQDLVQKLRKLKMRGNEFH